MFVNCKHCKALVATDPATDLPPDRCPRCGGVLREPQAPASPGAPGADPTVATIATAGATSAAPATPGRSESARPQAAESATPATAADGAATTVAPTSAATTTDATAPGTDTGGIGTAVPAIAAALIETVTRADDTPSPGPGPDTTTAGPDSVTVPSATQAPSAPTLASATVATPMAEPADDAAVTAPDPAPEAVASAGEPSLATAAPTEAKADTDAPAAARPAFLAKSAAATAGGGPRWRLPAAIATLVLLLGLQAVLADRERLAADAQWRPLVASVCGVFGCSLPPWREPDAFVLLAREVRPHPGVAGALRVRASFRNDARWAQALPRLVLTLSDVDGRAVAARAFDAGEYLAAATTASLVEPGQTVDIALDIREPSAATVSYAFDFR